MFKHLAGFGARGLLLLAVLVLDGCAPAVTELGTLGGLSSAFDVNDQGVAVGFSRTEDSSRDIAVRYLPGGQVVALPALPGDASCRAYVIANDGTVAGICTPAWPQPVRVVSWDGNDQASVLFEHTGEILPTDINEAGTIVGQAVAWETRHRTFAWVYDPDSSLVELPILPDAYAQEAHGINDAGTIVGTALISRAPDAPRRLAVSWNESSDAPSVLPTPSACEGKDAAAYSINSGGRIVGWCHDMALTWPPGSSTAEVLPRPPPLPLDTGPVVGARATGLNDSGDIIGWVGRSRGAATIITSVGWTAARRVADLGEIELSGINEARVTVGTRQGVDPVRVAVRVVW